VTTTDRSLVNAWQTRAGSGSERRERCPDAVATGVEMLSSFFVLETSPDMADRGIARAVMMVWEGGREGGIGWLCYIML